MRDALVLDGQRGRHPWLFTATFIALSRRAKRRGADRVPRVRAVLRRVATLVMLGVAPVFVGRVFWMRVTR